MNMPQIFNALGKYIVYCLGEEYKNVENMYFNYNAGVALLRYDKSDVFDMLDEEDDESVSFDQLTSTEFNRFEKFINSLRIPYLEPKKLYLGGNLYFTVTTSIENAQDVKNLKDLTNLLIVKGFLSSEDL